MTARLKYEGTAVDDAGNVLPSTQVEVRRLADGNLASLYAASTGATAVTNPHNTDADGNFEFWVLPGTYTVTVGVGASAYSKTVYLNFRPATPYDFGAAGDGVADDTAALVAWLESGGDLYAPDGTYLINSSVTPTISASTRVTASSGAIFKAAANLSGDMIRPVCDSAGYTSDRIISFEWTGGLFDQTGQENSTSVPYQAFYPPANVGASATAEGLSIRGEISVGGTPTAGFDRVIVRDTKFFASSTGHWESAGGDSGVFVAGTKHIHVEGVEGIGCRDLAIYTSGLSSGSIPGGTCYIGKNTFKGCMFGASSKRLMSNVIMEGNIGYNTAVLAIATDVTTSGDNVLIANNIGYGAWQVARVTGGEGVTVTGNQSFKHGHLRENGAVPTAIFQNDNAAVALNGTSKVFAYGNRVTGLNTGVTFSTAAVRLMDSDGTACSGAMVFDNTADGVASVVIEDASGADTTVAKGNHGQNLSGNTVVLTGASSIDRDGPIYEWNGTKAHTGVLPATVIETATIKQGTMRARDRLIIYATGTTTGTAGDKAFWLQLGGATARRLTPIPAAISGDWVLEGKVELNTLGSQRMGGIVFVESATGTTSSLEGQNFETGDIDITLLFGLGHASDTMTLNTFSVRLE